MCLSDYATTCIVEVNVDTVSPRAGRSMPTWCTTWVCTCCDDRQLNRVACLDLEISGKPDAGNPHVRFDEGGAVRNWSPRYSTLLSLLSFARSAWECHFDAPRRLHPPQSPVRCDGDQRLDLRIVPSARVSPVCRITHIAPLHRVIVDVVLEDDVAEEHHAILILEKPPRIEQDLNCLGPGEDGQPADHRAGQEVRETGFTES